MAYLIDTNVLLRALDPLDSQHRVCADAVSVLKYKGEQLVVSTQVLAEFWNIITRPIDAKPVGLYSLNGVDAERWLVKAETTFSVVPDPPNLYAVWRKLVIEYGVVGVQVHDARHAAWVLARGVNNLLTLNGKHFARYPGIKVFSPSDIRG
jgi:predicted nucleic acid-binding protein